jgi:hypothetical protein
MDTRPCSQRQDIAAELLERNEDFPPTLVQTDIFGQTLKTHKISRHQACPEALQLFFGTDF